MATFTALLGQAMPLYWFGIMLIIIFGVWLRWLPISGSGTWPIWSCRPLPWPPGFCPSICADAFRDARRSESGLHPHGPGERSGGEKVLIKHAFKNAAIPWLRSPECRSACFWGGAVVTETVFAWPGIGRLAVDSIRMGDYPVVQAIVVIFAFLSF